MMYGRGKSDSAIVAAKLVNKAGRLAAESVERRAGAKRKAAQRNARRAQDRESVSRGLDRIRKVAKERKKEKFTALFHHLSLDLLEQAFFELKDNAAPGVDGLTWTDYEADLERNLEGLFSRLHRGAYRAMPSRWVYIPKPDGRQRTRSTRRLPPLLVRVPSWAGSARRTRRPLCRDYQLEGELHIGRRHPVVLRHGEPGMADQVRGAPVPWILA